MLVGVVRRRRVPVVLRRGRRRDLFDRTRGRRGQPVERVRDVLRRAFQSGAEAGTQAKQLLDLPLELADLPQPVGAKRSCTLLRVRNHLSGMRARVALELLAALAHFVQRARELFFALPECVNASVQLVDLGLHRVRACTGGAEVVLQLLPSEGRAGGRQLDVSLLVAAEPRAPEPRLICHSAISVVPSLRFCRAERRRRVLSSLPYVLARLGAVSPTLAAPPAGSGRKGGGRGAAASTPTYSQPMNDGPALDALRDTAEEVAAEWRLELGAPFALSRYSYVAPAGESSVLKVTPAADADSDHEADALELWAGDGAVRLLRRDVSRRVLLAERAVPGHDLSGLPDAEATAIASELGAQLWRPAREPFRRVADHVPRWLENAEREPGRSRALLALARELWSSFEPGDEWVVHGDFHHHNILRHGDRYVAIDPKPYAADREYDVPSFLWNPLAYRLTDVARTERRIAAFVAAGLDDWKIRAWTVIRGAYLGADEEEAAVICTLLRN
jgi:streptomycin 6-kinase